MAGKPSMHKRVLNPAAVETIRAKIQTGMIIEKLSNHILKNEEMSNTQITAALGLLKKTTPDLSAVTANVEHAGEINHNHDLVAGAKELLLQRIAKIDESDRQA